MMARESGCWLAATLVIYIGGCRDDTSQRRRSRGRPSGDTRIADAMPGADHVPGDGDDTFLAGDDPSGDAFLAGDFFNAGDSVGGDQGDGSGEGSVAGDGDFLPGDSLPGDDDFGDLPFTCEDQDLDGFLGGCPAGDDCDDTSARVRPGRDEIPFNGVDDNCNGGSDEEMIFDVARLRDVTTADCTFSNPRVVAKDLMLLDVWDVSYLAWESAESELHPIRIRGFAARPQGATFAPGVVQAHGLGGFASEDHATGTAALLKMFVLAFTGPGGGPPAGTAGAVSEGLGAGDDMGTGNSGYRLFDTVDDVRGSWLWGHATAAMRGLTCLAIHPDVDSDRLGMTGYSAGAIATLLSAGADDRILAAVPLSGTLAFDLAVQAPNAWQHDLLAKAGLDTAGSEWHRLASYLVDATRALGDAPRARVMMVNGTIDEFFPLTAHMASYSTIPTPKRLSLAGNYDHGCFALGVPFVPESADTIEDRALVRTRGAQRLWLRHHFGTDDGYYGYVPAPPGQPIVAASDDALSCWASCELVPPCLYVAAAVDSGKEHLAVESVEFWWSNDAALNWANATLTYNDQLSGYDTCFNAAYDANITTYFVDVLYQTELNLSHTRLPRERFSLSSEVYLPTGHVPHVRSATSCTYP